MGRAVISQVFSNSRAEDVNCSDNSIWYVHHHTPHHVGVSLVLVRESGWGWLCHLPPQRPAEGIFQGLVHSCLVEGGVGQCQLDRVSNPTSVPPVFQPTAA